MIHFRVIRAGELAVWTALALLLAVVALLVIQAVTGGGTVSVSAPAGEIPSGLTDPGSAWTGLPDGPAAEEALCASSARLVSPTEVPLFAVREALRAEGMPLPLHADGEPASPAGAPRVLVYHTHTCESYTKEPGQEYAETELWRTDDPRYSVVRVGEALCEALRALGIDAVHDTTNHEPPELSTAYARSLETLAAYEAAGESFDLCLDLHRDAYTEALQPNTAPTDLGDTARILFLIGQGSGFSLKPDTAANSRFALLVSGELDAGAPGVCRGILEKSGRYNQHMGRNAVLVEVGNNRNTLTEALRAVPFLARALSDALRERAAPTPGPVLPVSSGG